MVREVLEKIMREIVYLGELMAEVSTYENFVSCEKTKRAAAMTLINIGEFGNNLSKFHKEVADKLPVKGMTNLRNAVAHGYYTLKFEFVWNTIQTDIPDLKSKVEKLLN